MFLHSTLEAAGTNPDSCTVLDLPGLFKNPLSALSPKRVMNPVRQPSAPSTQAAVAAGPPPCTAKSRAGCFSPGAKWSGNCTRTSTTLTPTAKASRGANSSSFRSRNVQIDDAPFEATHKGQSTRALVRFRGVQATNASIPLPLVARRPKSNLEGGKDCGNKDRRSTSLS